MQINPHIKNIAFVVLALVGLYSCSTQKDSIVNKTYHNTTARYNGYFNAKESVKEGLEKIQSGYKNDYTELLPIFIEGDDAAARGVYPQMDRAIEKCTDVIHRHSMYIKKEEHCKWIDDSYLMIGIANYYKKDFTSANDIFEYVAKEYKDNPERIDAMMWMAKSYIGLKNFNKANSFLNLAAGSEAELTKKKKAFLKTIRADFYVQQKSYGAAIPALKDAIEYTNNKKEKTRFTFIIAQLYQLQNQPSEASRYYAEVLKLNPEYEMAFYAKINRATLFEKGSSNFQDIKDELTKMLKDNKNVDYYDQIYFAMAELELKQGHRDEGIALLEKSATTSSSNVKQKTRTHLKLAKLYFDDKNYIHAQANYDSTVTYMDKNREDYLDIVDTRNGLTRIVKDILIIQREDSLQQLAKMSDKEVSKIIDNIIDEIIAEEDRKKQEELYNQQMMQTQAQNNMQNNMATGGGQWYFYNTNTVTLGKIDFKKKWGERKLEDNWRRKNKSSGASFDDGLELETIEEKDTLAGANDLKSPNYYLKNIPKTKEKLKTSDNAIIEALYDLGVQYKEGLGNTNESINTFESLIARYDTSKYHLNAYYQLYRLYLDAGNNSKKDHYKSLILQNHPESQYAKLIANPNYYNELKAEKDQINQLYESALNKYLERYFDAALTLCEKSKNNQNNDIVYKFLYLEGLIYSSKKDTTQLKSTLSTLAETYSETEEGKLAKEALIKLHSGVKPNETNSNTEVEEEKYSSKADQKHNFILIIPTSVMADNETKNAISDFNNKYYRQSGLKISSVLFGTDQRMYVVKDFNNVFIAMDYYNSFIENDEELKKINSSKFACYPISIDNYPVFYKDKDTDGYGAFFIKKYK